MAQIEGSPRVNQYTATAGQTEFTYEFEISEDEEIIVQQNEDTLTLTTEYTVTDAGEPGGGTVVLVTGATVDDIITLTADTVVKRETTFTAGGDFAAADINAEFDRLDDIVSELITSQGKGVQMEVYSATFDPNIPIPVATKALVVNAAGTGFEMSTYDPDEQVEEAAAQVTLCEDQVTLAEAQVALCEAEVVNCQTEVTNCQDEVALCQAEVDLCEAETAKCVAETALCEAETAKCEAETALCEGFADDASGYADDAAASAAVFDVAALDEDIIPADDSSVDLGSTSKRWAEVWADAGVFGDSLQVGTDSVMVAPTQYANYQYVTDGEGGSINATTWTQRPINTEVSNSISGMSLASNEITFPAGTYFFTGRCEIYHTFLTKLRLYTTVGTVTHWTYDCGYVELDLNIPFSGIVTFSAETDVALDMYCTDAQTTNGMGVDKGSNNVYLDLHIYKVA